VAWVDYLVDGIIADALAIIRQGGFEGRIVTFAIYYDHDGSVISVCADTLENSTLKQAESRAWTTERLLQSLRAGDLAQAGGFNQGIARSLSLGDFALKAIAAHELDPDEPGEDQPDSFFLALAQGLDRNTAAILAVCDPAEPALFACSTADAEVGLVWAPTRD